MPNEPFDPAAETIDQAKRGDASSFEGQNGYGVQFENGIFISPPPPTADGNRGGSNETNNSGGYPVSAPEPSQGTGTDTPPADFQKRQLDQGTAA